MSNKRDSTPLLPCVPAWLASTKNQTGNGKCPKRLNQLALPNLCIVMAVLREHYPKLGYKQRQTLQNLIERIEVNSKRKYNQTLFEQAKLMLMANCRASAEGEAKPLKPSLPSINNKPQTNLRKPPKKVLPILSAVRRDRKIHEDKRPTTRKPSKSRKKKIPKRCQSINFRERDRGLKIFHERSRSHVGLFEKIRNITLTYSDQNCLACIEFSATDSDILKTFISINNTALVHLLLDPLADKLSDSRNLIFIVENAHELTVECVHASKFKLIIKEYITRTNLYLELLIRDISHQTLPKIVPPVITSHNETDVINYQLFPHIDGHPPGTLNYACLAIYKYWQKQLKRNLKLYDTFKEECQKPIITRKCFYMYGAYHLWRLYSIHYSRILRNMSKLFHNKCVTYCHKCFDVQCVGEVLDTHYVPSDLIQAVRWNRFWNKSLVETIRCVKSAQI